MKRGKCINCFKRHCNVFDNDKGASCEVVCNEICGNLLLDDSNPELIIWENNIDENVIVTVSVFNSAMSMTPISVFIDNNEENSHEFTVPPGNTLSRTVDDNINSIRIMRVGNGRAEGKFCIELCFPLRCNDRRINKSEIKRRKNINCCKQNDISLKTNRKLKHYKRIKKNGYGNT